MHGQKNIKKKNSPILYSFPKDNTNPSATWWTKSDPWY